MLVIEPDAWLKCFAESQDLDPKRVKEKILARVRQEERQYARSRTRPVLGARALTMADMRKSYLPSKRGRRMLCLSASKELRIQFVKWFKDYVSRRPVLNNAVALREKLRDLPPGLYAPGGIVNANFNPLFLPRSP